MSLVKAPSAAARALNGLFCVYKPAGAGVRRVRHTLLTNLCRDLNALPDDTTEQRIEILGETNAQMEVMVVPNYADSPLVMGPRYQQQDFRCAYATHLGSQTSGLLLFGINDGTQLTRKVHLARPTRAYMVRGQLGKATDNCFSTGKIVEKSGFKHVTRAMIDKVVAYMQSAHQKKMFDVSGVHLNSQAMFEMASQGLIRPTESKLPVLYGIKCVHFEPPHFTLEIQAINEYESYLWALVQELGMQLKSSAFCTSLSCVRQGRFTLDYALLRKHWTLNHIIDNIALCQEVLNENQRLLKPASAALL